MYVVHVMYPNPGAPGQQFDIEHYFKIHMPMGVGLMNREYGVTPLRVEVTHDTYGADRTHNSAGYNCFGSVYFETKEEVDHFIDLFDLEQPRSLLEADWPKYTPANPVALIGKVTSLDPAETLTQSKAVIESAEAELAVSGSGAPPTARP